MAPPPPPPPPPALCLPFGKKKTPRRLDDANTIISEKAAAGDFFLQHHHYPDSNDSLSYSSRSGSYPSGRSRSLPRSGSHHDFPLPDTHSHNRDSRNSKGDNPNKIKNTNSKDSLDDDLYSPTATITSKGGEPTYPDLDGETDRGGPPESLAFKTDSESYAHLPSARTSSPPPPQPRRLGFGFGWVLRKQREREMNKAAKKEKEMKEKGRLTRNNSLPPGVGSGIYSSSAINLINNHNNPYGEFNGNYDDGLNSARTSQFSLVSPNVGGSGGYERAGVRPRGALTPIPDVDEPPLTRSSSSKSQPPPIVPPKRSNTQKTNVTQRSTQSKRSAGGESAAGGQGANLSRYNSNSSSVARRHLQQQLDRSSPQPTDSQSTLVGSALERKMSADDEPIKKTKTTEKLQKLRALMEKEKLDYYVVPSEDAHGSEYVADCDKRREYISGFTGSAGTAIVSKSYAYLVTDSRYWLQAEVELGDDWKLVRAPSPIREDGPKDWESFLVERILSSVTNAYYREKQGGESGNGMGTGTCVRIGLDARMISYLKASSLITTLQRLTHPILGPGVPVNAKLAFPSQNLIDLIWGKDKPMRSLEPVYVHDRKFCGEDARDKIRRIRKWIEGSEAARPAYAKPSFSSSTGSNGDGGGSSGGGGKVPEGQRNVATLISGLANIAWILNMRGKDIPFNPVFTSYLFIGLDSAVLFIEKAKVEPPAATDTAGKASSNGSGGSGRRSSNRSLRRVQTHLQNLGVQVQDYNQIWSFLRRSSWGSGRVLIDPQTSYAISLLLTHFKYTLTKEPGGVSVVDGMKAVKNAVEIEGLRRAYRRDGASWVRWAAWMEDKFAKNYTISEWEAGYRLSVFREKYGWEYEGAGGVILGGEEGGEKVNYFRGLSYEPISATGPNAALPHYTPRRSTAGMIEMGTPYLNDSGAQYLDGTIDTTRTMFFGLGGERPTLEMCEAYTRVLQGHIAIDSAIFPMGTSGRQLDVLARNTLWKDGLNYLHGTGHGFGSFLNVHEGPQSFSSDVPLVPGHVITNEPGFYYDKNWGIRIESALLVKKVTTKYSFQGDVWLGFERLTVVPIQTKMVKDGMLTKDEIAWIKEHNKRCYTELEPLLKDDKRALKWLKREAERGIGQAGPVSVPGVNGAGLHIDWD